MLTLTFQKKDFLHPFQLAANAVDKKQLSPLLSHVLLRITQNAFIFTGSDLEMELSASLPAAHEYPVTTLTIPSKKVLDILKTLEESASFTLALQETTLYIQADSGRFKLTTLPADNFPLIPEQPWTQSFTLPRTALIHLFESTIFAISQQDARLFLNGMLWECEPKQITTVGADGHRMAIAHFPYSSESPSPLRVILPRRAVLECLRLLHTLTEETVCLSIHPQFFQLKTACYHLTSKLIDANYLPYHQALPKALKTFVMVAVPDLKRAILRTLVVFSDKGCPVILDIQPDTMILLAQNKEQDEVTETVPITLDGPSIRIGLNPFYVLDVLNLISGDTLKLSFQSPGASMLVEPVEGTAFQYIIMPMKL